MNEQARALLLAGVTLFGAGNGSGYMLGRSTAPAAVVAPKTSEAASATQAPKTAATAPKAAPRVKAAPVVRERPPAKKKRAAPTVRPAPRPATSLPSCAVVRREYERMNHAQRLAAYARATSEQVAHGRRCLGI